MEVPAEHEERPGRCDICGGDMTQTSVLDKLRQVGQFPVNRMVDTQRCVTTVVGRDCRNLSKHFLNGEGLLRSRLLDMEVLIRKTQAERTTVSAKWIDRQPWWKKWFVRFPRDESIEQLGKQIFGLEQDLRSVQKRIDGTNLKIRMARKAGKQFDLAARMGANQTRQEGTIRDRNQQFDANCIGLLNKIEIDRTILNIRKKDYKRGNRLDNHFRKKIAEHVIAAFGHECLYCGANRDLTLDHFAIPKNEGGNCVLSVKEGGSSHRSPRANPATPRPPRSLRVHPW